MGNQVPTFGDSGFLKKGTGSEQRQQAHGFRFDFPALRRTSLDPNPLRPDPRSETCLRLHRAAWIARRASPQTAPTTSVNRKLNWKKLSESASSLKHWVL